MAFNQADDGAATEVRAVRRFNRFFTRRVGVLDPYLGSTLSLTEVRVLYELAHCESCTASALARELGLDGGYLSRLLKRFEAAGWLQRSTSAKDARQSLLAITEAGRAAFEPLEQKSREAAAALLAPLAPAARLQLVEAMQRIENLLEPDRPARTRTALLRDPQPGDIGWVVQQHGALYWREYGWNSEFEALVADIAAQFVRKFQPQWEKCWIAELDGERVGSVFVVPASRRVAQLRLLLVDPRARGRGLGTRLVRESIDFARAQGYARLVLWTQSNLAAARAIYRACGFGLRRLEPHAAFGVKLTGEYWERRL